MRKRVKQAEKPVYQKTRIGYSVMTKSIVYMLYKLDTFTDGNGTVCNVVYTKREGRDVNLAYFDLTNPKAPYDVLMNKARDDYERRYKVVSRW